MATKEQLEFFKNKKSSDELFKEFGYQSGVNILKEVLEEGFVIDDKDKKFYLTDTGKRKLKEMKNEEREEKKSLILKHPLLSVLISVALTALLTYFVTISAINYENELSLKFLGENEITVPPSQTIDFNGIVIYNPTSKKVSLKNMYVDRPASWINNQRQVSEQDGEENNEDEVIYNVPGLVQDYAPYMVLESGDTKLMSGQFTLTAPSKEGKYALSFYTLTLDGKRHEVDKKLIIEVVE